MVARVNQDGLGFTDGLSHSRSYLKFCCTFWRYSATVSFFKLNDRYQLTNENAERFTDHCGVLVKVKWSSKNQWFPGQIWSLLLWSMFLLMEGAITALLYSVRNLTFAPKLINFIVEWLNTGKDNCGKGYPALALSLVFHVFPFFSHPSALMLCFGSRLKDWTRWSLQEEPPMHPRHPHRSWEELTAKLERLLLLTKSAQKLA